MPPEVRIVGLGSHLPGPPIPASSELFARLDESAEAIEARTGVQVRHFAPEGQGPSDLALQAAHAALARAAVDVPEVELIVFATSTPDVTFPGAACYLQEKLTASTVGALDARAQSVGFLCALELGVSFAEQAAREADAGPYRRVLVAAGEVLSSGLDFSPQGADLTPRFGDGAAVAVLGRAETGLRLGALRWYVDGALAESFWCEYPASRRYPMRIRIEDLASGRQFPRARLAELAPVARARLGEVVREVLSEMGWSAGDLDVLVIDYVEPELAWRVASDLGVDVARTAVPTAWFGHVLAAGVPIALDRLAAEQRLRGRILVATAGPGFAWGAAALEA